MKDLFSKQSDAYAKYRPTYPTELYEFILKYVPGREAAWDCATGNGQVAVALAEYFERVEATDISEQQLAQAEPAQRVHYQVSRAEETNFPAQSFDLVTVGQALHWFNFETFHSEVKRVLKPGGVLAVWGYELLEISPEIDPLILDFYTTVVGPYWAPERHHIQEKYTKIPFPYQEVQVPVFSMIKQWSLEELSGYFSSWSSVQAYKEANGEDPVPELIDQISPLWDVDQVQEIEFPIFMRLGINA
ncbi:SAM-dependent methyltransferase [Siphonobacter sp. BAB-5385]|uniref:class I SAM-dependent methyltransferase n=1 Tax=Siphonobacter sp. BAB-5385 TaxID=1864822 RepID=UPI000B9EE8E7|nr:class I SAM-dependent methyltransferase [Siphonobacter sp. BAB-5385]OZI08501.1 SAM-dependent methyltransferase [Siphonobacter sp. BAB-5385]